MMFEGKYLSASGWWERAKAGNRTAWKTVSGGSKKEINWNECMAERGPRMGEERTVWGMGRDGI